MPRTAIKITDDKRKWNKLQSQAHYFRAKPGIFVGILEEDGSQGKLQLDDERSQETLASVAFYNEFGTATIPARSFIRAPFDETSGYASLRKSVLKRVLDGSLTLIQGLNIIGSGIAKSFRKRINDGIDPPNTEQTVENKLSDKPLVATGELLDSIAYKLTQGNE